MNIIITTEDVHAYLHRAGVEIIYRTDEFIKELTLLGNTDKVRNLCKIFDIPQIPTEKIIQGMITLWKKEGWKTKI